MCAVHMWVLDRRVERGNFKFCLKLIDLIAHVRRILKSTITTHIKIFFSFILG